MDTYFKSPYKTHKSFNTGDALQMIKLCNCLKVQVWVHDYTQISALILTVITEVVYQLVIIFHPFYFCSTEEYYDTSTH